MWHRSQRSDGDWRREGSREIGGSCRIGKVTFGQAAEETLKGAIFTPHSGYVSDPQLSTHNVQRAAEAKDAEFLFKSEVIEIRKMGERVAGVTLKDGERILVIREVRVCEAEGDLWTGRWGPARKRKRRSSKTGAGLWGGSPPGGGSGSR